MNEQEEYLKMVERLSKDDYSDGFIDGASEGWETCSEFKNKIIDKQAAEIAALRLFSKQIIVDSAISFGLSNDYILITAKSLKLIDKNGNPTKLLTGEE